MQIFHLSFVFMRGTLNSCAVIMSVTLLHQCVDVHGMAQVILTHFKGSQLSK